MKNKKENSIDKKVFDGLYSKVLSSFTNLDLMRAIILNIEFNMVWQNVDIDNELEFIRNPLEDKSTRAASKKYLKELKSKLIKYKTLMSSLKKIQKEINKIESSNY